MATNAYSRNTHNVPDFFDGYTKGNNFFNGLKRDSAMRDAEQASPESLGLANVMVQNPNDMGPQPLTGPDGAEAARTGPTSMPPPPADIAAARTAKRASIMRQYGDTEGANRELQAEAQLGLSAVQIDETKQRVASGAIKQRGDQLGLDSKEQSVKDEAGARAIKQQYAAQLRGAPTANGANPEPPTSDDVFSNRIRMVNALDAAGYGAHSDAERTSLTAAIKSKVTADSEQRNEDGKAALSALEGPVPNFAAALAFSKKWSYGRDDTLDSIEPGSKPGTLKLTLTRGGKQQTGELPQAEMIAKMRQGIGQMTNKETANFVLEQGLLTAQIKQSGAAAGASNAAAGLSDASTRSARDTLTRNQVLRTAYDTPADQRTPEQAQMLAGRVESADDVRPDVKHALTPWEISADALGAPKTRFNRSTGVTETMDPTSKQWVRVGGGPAAAGAAPPAAAAAGSVPTPKSKGERDALPKGTTYQAPDGKLYIK